MRSGASVSQLFAERSVPRAARTMRSLSMRVMRGRLRVGSSDEFEAGLKDVAQRCLHGFRESLVVGAWPVAFADFGGLLHIGAAGELHLDGVDTFLRPPVIAGDPAAPEAAVGNPG